MKAITFLGLLYFICISCNCQKKAAEQSNAALKQDMENTLIEYVANTRGFYQKIVIQNKKIAVSKDREVSKMPEAISISESDWKELVIAFNEINLNELPNLKAPTEKRFYDGAANATLKITFKEKLYESTTFDHGIPPAAIEKFVNKINSLVKQE
jgi:hypothetical protein